MAYSARITGTSLVNHRYITGKSAVAGCGCGWPAVQVVRLQGHPRVAAVVALPRREAAFPPTLRGARCPGAGRTEGCGFLLRRFSSGWWCWQQGACLLRPCHALHFLLGLVRDNLVSFESEEEAL